MEPVHSLGQERLALLDRVAHAHLVDRRGVVLHSLELPKQGVGNLGAAAGDKALELGDILNGHDSGKNRCVNA